jgi:hypothetical protein
MSRPLARWPRTAKQPSSTSRTGMMLVWPSQSMLRTGRDSISRLIATGAASREVRLLTGWGRARAATRPRATTSSSEPKVQPQPRACSAVLVSGLSTSPAKGVPVKRVESYSEPFTCRTPFAPTHVSRSVRRSPRGVLRTTATCRTARTAATSHRPSRATRRRARVAPTAVAPKASAGRPLRSAFATPRRPPTPLVSRVGLLREPVEARTTPGGRRRQPLLHLTSVLLLSG